MHPIPIESKKRTIKIREFENIKFFKLKFLQEQIPKKITSSSKYRKYQKKKKINSPINIYKSKKNGENAASTK